MAKKTIESRTGAAFYSETRAPVPASNESAEPFQAALLHPKKQNLTIETMVLPGAPEENMVTIIFKLHLFIYKILSNHFRFHLILSG